MSLRIGGVAAIIGSALLTVTWFLAYGLVDVDFTVAAVILTTGIGVLLVAIAGLSAFQARVAPRLIWGAFAVTAAGTIVAIGGFVALRLAYDDLYWNVGAFGVVTAFVGSELFAIATYRTAALSRGAAVLLGVGSVLPFVSLFARNLEFLVAVGLFCFLLGWFALGFQAIRLDRPTAEQRAA